MKLKTATGVQFLLVSGFAPEVTNDDVMSFLDYNNLQKGIGVAVVKDENKETYNNFRLAG